MHRREIILGLVCGSLVPVHAAATPPVVDLDIGRRMAVGSVTEIPRRNGQIPYQSYSLFVATEPQFTNADAALAKEFDAFGKSIGDKNLAVFVMNKLNGELDISSGRTIVDLVNQKYGLSLPYDKGPYVLQLASHPADPKAPGESAVVVEFAGLSSSEVNASLKRLSALVTSQTPGGSPNGLFKVFWLRISNEFNSQARETTAAVARMFVSS